MSSGSAQDPRPRPGQGHGAGGRESAPGTDEARIQALLAEAERTVEELRAELSARQRLRARKEVTAAQHAEIDRLAEHLANAQVHWGQVRSFFEAALDELREPASQESEYPGAE